jgi:hypothetical protein
MANQTTRITQSSDGNIVQHKNSDSSPLSQVTAPPQLHNNSENLDRAVSPSHESSPEEPAGGQSKCKQPVTHSLATSRSRPHSATKRARRISNTTNTQSNSIAMNDKSRNESPIWNENEEIIDSANTASHYLGLFDMSTSKYGDNTSYRLTLANIIDVIRAGDSFTREDSIIFMSLYLERLRDGLWHNPNLEGPPLDSSPVQKALKSFHYAEILEQRSTVDPIRL